MSFEAWKEVNFSRGFKRSKTLTSKVSWHNSLKLHYIITSQVCTSFNFLMVLLLIIRRKKKISLLKNYFLSLPTSLLWIPLGFIIKVSNLFDGKRKQTARKETKFNSQVFYALIKSIFHAQNICEQNQLSLIKMQKISRHIHF